MSMFMSVFMSMSISKTINILSQLIPFPGKKWNGTHVDVHPIPFPWRLHSVERLIRNWGLLTDSSLIMTSWRNVFFFYCLFYSGRWGFGGGGTIEECIIVGLPKYRNANLIDLLWWQVYVCEECGHTTNEPEVHYLHLKENHPYSPALLKFYDKRHFKFSNNNFTNMLLQVRS